MPILFINACVRPQSRTRRIAEYLLDRLSGETETLTLEREPIAPLDNALLERRTALLEQGRFDDPMLRYARQFAQADEIVIAAPYWDLSFPASLKAYFEAINAVGVTFAYDAQGVPHGLCRAKRLFYLTTAGGPILSDDLGYGYVRLLCSAFYGIADIHYLKAEGLDLPDVDVEALLRQCFRQIDRLLSETPS
ncbi:MAG: NAD(P)H-dependent oxidoreductase [Clostridia bacterium]|nr:NAD(P)H-dependent oxidoreductase [Clostridia bacterium]